MSTQLYPHVIADPDILAGKPVIEGTTVPVHLLVAQVAMGKSLDEVARSNGVRVEDVRAALEYVARLAEDPVAAPVLVNHSGSDDTRATVQPAAVDEEARRVGLDPAQLSPLGRRLLELRVQGIAAGEPLLSTREALEAEIRERRGGAYPDAE